MKNKCPHCSKTYCVRDVVVFNCESYGDIGTNGYDLPCIHCGEMIYVTVLKSVQITDVEKSTVSRKDGDW